MILPRVGETVLIRELVAMERPNTAPVLLIATLLVMADVVMTFNVVPPTTIGMITIQNWKISVTMY